MNLGGWVVELQEDNVADVLPVDDLRPHVHGVRCWCQPRTEENPHGVTIAIHNALDEREKHERGKLDA